MISCQYFAVHGLQMQKCCKSGAGNTGKHPNAYNTYK